MIQQSDKNENLLNEWVCECQIWYFCIKIAIEIGKKNAIETFKFSRVRICREVKKLLYA